MIKITNVIEKTILSITMSNRLVYIPGIEQTNKYIKDIGRQFSHCWRRELQV